MGTKADEPAFRACRKRLAEPRIHCSRRPTVENPWRLLLVMLRREPPGTSMSVFILLTSTVLLIPLPRIALFLPQLIR